jgi:hypothetical protein
MLAKLKRKKTHIVAGMMVLVSVVNLLVGDMSLVEFAASPHLNTMLEGLGLSAVRAGIAKAELP